MGRFTKNHSMEIGAVFLGIGVVLSALGYLYQFLEAPDWLAWYAGILDGIPGGDASAHNLWIMIVGTLSLIGGGWVFGEQLSLRRRFERLIDTPKKSEFVSNRPRLEALARRLPDEYKGRVKSKESEFRSAR